MEKEGTLRSKDAWAISDEWGDKTTGQKRTSIELHGQRVHFLEWDDRGAPTTKPGPRKIEEPVPEDDIPF